MATNKREARLQLLEIAGREECEETWKGALPDTQHKGRAWLKRLLMHNAFEDGVRYYTLIDGAQTIFHLQENRYDSTNADGTRTFRKCLWRTTRDSYVRWTRKWLMEDLDAFDEQEVVLAFDNSRATSLAKRATQVKRRLDVIRAAHKKQHKIRLPGAPDVIDCDAISENDLVPEERHTCNLWSKYRDRVNEFLLHRLMVVQHRNLVNSQHSRFLLWHRGRMYVPRSQRRRHRRRGGGDAETPLRSEFVDSDMHPNEDSWQQDYALTRMYEMMGEYDFFALRYALETVERTIVERRRSMGIDADEDIANTDVRGRVYNLSNLVFRIVTTDTDLLIYMLWFLEHVMMRYELSLIDLPCVFCVSPWAASAKSTSYVISVKKMFMKLKAALRDVDNTPGYSVRSFMSSILFWGNDFLPSPHGITARTAIRAYMLANPAVASIRLCEKPRGYSRETAPHAVQLCGAGFRVLFALWYATKCLWHNELLSNRRRRREDLSSAAACVDDDDDDDDDDERETIALFSRLRTRFADADEEDIEQYVYDACNGGRRAAECGETRKSSVPARSRIPRRGSAVLSHRLGLFACSVYFVEHALKARPGHSVSLRDIGLLGGGGGGSSTGGDDGAKNAAIRRVRQQPFYIDLHEHMRAALTTRQQELLGALGLYGEGCYLRWNDALMQAGDDDSYVYDDAALRELGEKAESIFIWKELDM